MGRVDRGSRAAPGSRAQPFGGKVSSRGGTGSVNQSIFRPTFLRPRELILALLLLILVAGAYLPAIRGGFIWDDDSYVTENRQLKDVAGLGRIWFQPSATPQYYPLVHTSFWIERHLWGLHPLGFHLVNVLLHVLSALILWRILTELNVPGALFAAFVFGVHPLQVESVAWVTERKNVLSGVLYLAAALAFIRAKAAGERDSRDGGPGKLYRLSLLFFGASLLAKTVTATLPVGLLLVLWWKWGRVRKEDWLRLLPMFALGIFMGLMTVLLEKRQVGASGAEWDLNLADRLLIAGRAVAFYLGKLVWPSKLAFSYPRWSVHAGALGQYLYPIGVAGALVVLYRLRGRVGRGPLAAMLFFVATLGPALGFLDVYPFRYSFVADHFQYLACIGPISLFAAGGDRALRRIRAAGRVVPPIAAGTVCLVLAALSWRQAGIYKDQETLWRDTIAKNPASWLAHNNLGRLFLLRGELEPAIAQFDLAIGAKGDYFEAYLNRGSAKRKRGDLDGAIGDYETAAMLEPRDPAPHFNRGNLEQDLGRHKAAIEAYDQAIAHGLDDAGVYVSRGNASLAIGRYDAAIDDYGLALARRPDSAEAYNNRAVAHFKRGDYPRAWADVAACRRAGGSPNQRFLDDLAKASGDPGRP